MLPIQKSLARFTQCLEQNIPIVCEKTGFWSQETKPKTLVRWLSGNKDKHLFSIGRAFNTVLENLEKSPVIFGTDAEAISARKHIYQSYFNAAKAVKNKLKSSSNMQVKNQFVELGQKVAGLSYRIEAIHGGLDPVSPDKKLYQSLTSCAALWKGKQKAFSEKTLSARDRKKIAEACIYPKFVKVLLKSPSLQASFFSWVIRENMGVRQFVEFPSTSVRIKNAHLSSRIGYFGGTLLDIKKEKIENDPNNKAKIITLPFHTIHKVEHLNILDESREVVLNGDWHLNIKKILDCFKGKNKCIGDLEFFGPTGINNWNAHELGFLDPQTKKYMRINLSIKEWWNFLPVFQEFSSEQVQQKYDIKLTPGEWLVCAMGSRTTTDLDLDGTHGYLEVLIPTKEGRYRVFPFGKFAKDFPQSTWELLTFLAGTVTGKLSFPDENKFCAHRQQAVYPFTLTPLEGSHLMYLIKQELIKARQGDSIFQFGGENCAFWVQATLEKIKGKQLPNFYKLELLKNYPHNPVLAKIFALIRKIPTKLQPAALNLVDRSFGSARAKKVKENGKEVYKSVMTCPSRAEQVIYQPSYLHEQIIKKKLRGFVSYGY